MTVTLVITNDDEETAIPFKSSSLFESLDGHSLHESRSSLTDPFYQNHLFLPFKTTTTGFLPSLEGGASRGNFGLMDQVAALHWIQENIAEFGGDASNVTLAGHGYGASTVNLLMVSPMVRGKTIRSDCPRLLTCQMLSE
jgi:hypothetical protein